MSAVRQRIATRSLAHGDRLPSIRATAAAMKVSVSTVVDAYERLAAEGAVHARPGSGFYVSAPTAPLALAEIGPRLDRAVDPLWVSRQSLEAHGDVLRPGCGWLPESWLPQSALRGALRALARADDAALAEYGTPLGLPALRQLLSRRMGERGINVPPQQILLTDSGTQAIDLLCRFLVEPGDTVLVDDPCYFNFLALLRAHRVRAIGVPMTHSGPDIEQFQRALSEGRPRLYITNSGLHNPTGVTISPVTTHHVLKLAEEARVTIIEDDILADFAYAPAPRLAAFDGIERVAHVGSFSKTLSASMRCGFIAARKEWIDGLVDLRIASSFGGGRLAAELVLHALRDGGYRKHVERLRQRLSHAMADVTRRLGAVGIEPWLKPAAGMFLWCRLPCGIDAADLARAALAQRIVLAPGNAFSLSQSAHDRMRFNVSQSQDERLYDFLRSQIKR
jgi:DNA-binding transcriptional MocR family regulator